MGKVALIAPVINEGDTIAAVIRDVPRDVVERATGQPALQATGKTRCRPKTIGAVMTGPHFSRPRGIDRINTVM